MEILHVAYHTKNTEAKRNPQQIFDNRKQKKKHQVKSIVINRGEKTHTTHNVAEIKLRKSHNNKENKQSKKKHNTQTHREKSINVLTDCKMYIS